MLMRRRMQLTVEGSGRSLAQHIHRRKHQDVRGNDGRATFEQPKEIVFDPAAGNVFTG
jgi:hypothetical protein